MELAIIGANVCKKKKGILIIKTCRVGYTENTLSVKQPLCVSYIHTLVVLYLLLIWELDYVAEEVMGEPIGRRDPVPSDIESIFMKPRLFA